MIKQRYSKKYRAYRVSLYVLALSLCALLVIMALISVIPPLFGSNSKSSTIRESLWRTNARIGRLAEPIEP